MKATVQRTTKVLLELNELDARFLMAYMQNPSHENEDMDVSKFRADIFNSLYSALNENNPQSPSQS